MGVGERWLGGAVLEGGRIEAKGVDLSKVDLPKLLDICGDRNFPVVSRLRSEEEVEGMRF